MIRRNMGEIPGKHEVHGSRAIGDELAIQLDPFYPTRGTIWTPVFEHLHERS
jgi:hypothetical protein